MKKRILPVLLVICLITGLFPINPQYVDASGASRPSLGDIKDKFDTALEAAEAVSYLTEGDVDKFLEIMSSMGVKAAGEMALGALFSVGTLAVESTVGITNWALDYNIENRFQEYRNLRFSAIESKQDLSAGDVREWIANGRAQFDDYWATNIMDGAIRVKYINEIKERKLSDFGYTKWLWAKLNPYSEDAKLYSSVMNTPISDATIAGYVFDDWEKAVLTEAYSKLPKIVKENSNKKLKNIHISIRGYISFDKKPDSSICYELLARDGAKAEYKKYSNSYLSEQTNTFRIDIPLENLKLNDKIQLILRNSKDRKDKAVKEINVSELLKSPLDEAPDANTGNYLKRFDAGSISETAIGSAQSNVLNLIGILPSGQSIKLTVNNILEFFNPAQSNPYMYSQEPGVPNRAAVEYSDNGKIYYAVAGIPEDGSQGTIQFAEPPAIPAPKTASELDTALNQEIALLRDGKLSPGEYTARQSSILSSAQSAGITGDQLQAARTKNQAALKDLANSYISSCTAAEKEFAAKFTALKSTLDQSMSELNNMYIYMNLYHTYFDDTLVKDFQRSIDDYNTWSGSFYSKYGQIISTIAEIDKLKKDLQLYISQEKEKGYSILRAANVSYNYGSNANAIDTSSYANAYNSESLENFKGQAEGRKARIEERIALVNENAATVKANIKKYYALGAAFENARIEKLQGYIKSCGANWEKDKSAVGHLMGTGYDYFRCKNDNIPDGIALWGKAFRESLPAGIPALNRLNRYFGGTAFDDAYIAKNSSDQRLILPLLSGLERMHNIITEPNPYWNYIYDVFSYWDGSNTNFKWLYLSESIPEGTSDAHSYIRNKLKAELAPDMDKIYNSSLDVSGEMGNMLYGMDMIRNGLLNEFDKGFYNVQRVSGKDIDNHWAKKDIELMLKAGYVTNVVPDTFEPNMLITRQEFCQFIVLTLGLPLEEYRGTFKDVSPNSSYGRYIEAACKAGVVGGTGKDTFSPEGFITREQIAVMAAKALTSGTKKTTAQLSAGFKAGFSDMKNISSWAVEYVKATVAQGIMNGKGKGTFLPKDNTTRAEAAVIIERIAQKLGK